MAREEFDEDSPEWVEFGRRVFARECRFIAGAVRIAQLPETGAVPEIAFAGRSNVGKSSLVNALTGRKTLARTSNSPGRTQELNFFDLSGHLVLADLPGYGFASAPKAKVMQWTALADSYLKGRPSLRRVCILIDARHGVKDVDRRVMTMLDEAAVSYQTVLTKSDKITASQLRALIEETGLELARHVAAHPRIMPTSARTGDGIPELRAALAALAAPLDLI